MTRAVGVPAEDGSGLASVQAPPKLARQFQSSRSWHGRIGPVQEGLSLIELRLNIGTEVEGQPEVVAAAVDLVGDVEDTCRPVQPDPAPVPGRRVERQVAVVLRGPFGDLVSIMYFDLPSVRVPQP